MRPVVTKLGEEQNGKRHNGCHADKACHCQEQRVYSVVLVVVCHVLTIRHHHHHHVVGGGVVVTGGVGHEALNRVEVVVVTRNRSLI